MSPRVAIAFGVVALCAICLGVYARMQAQPPTDQLVGDLRPEFNLPDLEGTQRSIAEWDGKIIVLNFWATWCAPCVEEIPEFIALQDAYGDQGVQFIGVAVDEAEPVAEFATKFGMNYPVLVGQAVAAGISGAFGNDIGALPYTAIIDRDKQVVFTRRGILDRETAEAAIQRLL